MDKFCIQYFIGQQIPVLSDLTLLCKCVDLNQAMLYPGQALSPLDRVQKGGSLCLLFLDLHFKRKERPHFQKL